METDLKSDSDCKRIRGGKDRPLWKWIEGKCYAFGEDGKMYCDCVTSNGYKVDHNGNWLNKDSLFLKKL